MKFEESPAGLLIVSYAVADDLRTDLQAPVVARLEKKQGKVVVVFDVADAVRSVPMDVPNFWLGVTGRRELQIAGMGIVTRSIAVRVAARGFALANAARGVPTIVQTFTDLESASSWGTAMLAG